jgi:hypothetical protein
MWRIVSTSGPPPSFRQQGDAALRGAGDDHHEISALAELDPTLVPFWMKPPAVGSATQAMLRASLRFGFGQANRDPLPLAHPRRNGTLRSMPHRSITWLAMP